MNLMNTTLIETINSNMHSNKYTSMPRWAYDEKIYLCEQPVTVKKTFLLTTVKENALRLFQHPIVNKS